MKRVGLVLLLAALTASAQVRSSSPQRGPGFAPSAGRGGFSAPARSAAPAWRGGGGYTFSGGRRSTGVRVGNWTFRTVPSRPGCPGFNCVSYPYYPSYYPIISVPYYPSYGYSVYDMGQPGVPPPSNDYIYADNGASQSQSSAGAQASAYDAGYAAGLQNAANTASRYGDHYLDSRENAPPAAPPQVTVIQGSEASKPATRSYTSAAPAPISPATVLIFNDGRTVEVHNYAIIGQTLWNLSEQVARKIPLTDLNLDATVKANDERGVTFKLPGAQ